MNERFDQPGPANLRQWTWHRMPDYNGFSHEERVKGWQYLCWLIDHNMLPKPRKCVISGATDRLQCHLENYYDPWTAVALTQPIHFALHRRFTRPSEWQAIVDRYAVSGEEWFALLAPHPVDIAAQLRKMHGDQVRDVFAQVECVHTAKRRDQST